MLSNVGAGGGAPAAGAAPAAAGAAAAVEDAPKEKEKEEEKEESDDDVRWRVWSESPEKHMTDLSRRLDRWASDSSIKRCRRIALRGAGGRRGRGPQVESITCAALAFSLFLVPESVVSARIAPGPKPAASPPK